MSGPGIGSLPTDALDPAAVADARRGAAGRPVRRARCLARVGPRHRARRSRRAATRSSAGSSTLPGAGGGCRRRRWRLSSSRPRMTTPPRWPPTGHRACPAALERLAGSIAPARRLPGAPRPVRRGRHDPGADGLGGAGVLRLRGGRVRRGHGQGPVQAHLRSPGPAGRCRGWRWAPSTGAIAAARSSRRSRRSSPTCPIGACVVKPARLGSSIGISIVHRPDEPPELESAIEHALAYGDLALAEPYLDHPRELEVAVVGDGSRRPRGVRPGRGPPGA